MLCPTDYQFLLCYLTNIMCPDTMYYFTIYGLWAEFQYLASNLSPICTEYVKA